MRTVNDHYMKLFILTTFALLVFGIASQVMSEAMGYTLMVGEYFLYLLPSIATGLFLLSCKRLRWDIHSKQ